VPIFDGQVQAMATVPTRARRPANSPAPGPHIDATADRLSLRIPGTAFSLAGFRAWVKGDDFPERVRVTYIGGEIDLDMSNEEIQTHVAVKTEITRVLANLARELDLGTLFGDGVLVTNEAADVSNNPDATFVTFDGMEAGNVRMIPRQGAEGQFTEIEGTPDLVVEIVSNSSVAKDTTRLRAAYHRAGIPEYWLIDARGPEIVFQILDRRRKGYAAVPVRDEWLRSRVFGRGFRLVRDVNRAGLWRYTLHVKAD
jgi:Uma2 family endonuclease